MTYLSLKELCEELSISAATGRNWIKLKKIIPEYMERKTPYFSKEYVEELKKDILSGANTALKSRRNKKYISGNVLYRSYVSENCKNVEAIECLLQIISQNEVELDEQKIQIFLADCAVKLFAQRFKKNNESKISFLDFLEEKIDFGEKNCLIRDLILDVDETKKWMEENQELFSVSYIYEENEDILGLLYISCKNMKKRKEAGSYYTPTKIVHKLIEKVVEKNGTDKTIMDPCCGTGNFLLHLPEEFSIENIYGNDLDEISVKVTRLNMALRFKDADIDLIYRNITFKNYLQEECFKADVVIGNPPWGYEFNRKEREYLESGFQTAKKRNIESYDVFVESALSKLNPGGILAFVLPEAILNVKMHREVRQILTENCSIQYIEFLGNAFDKVHCPCIILQIQKTGEKMSCLGMEVNDGKRIFQINQERKVNPEYFGFLSTDEEFEVLQKINQIENAVYLKDNAKFALGIVTGKNEDYISGVKTDENEMILKGSDLCRFRFNDSGNYITFKPEQFQQAAPTEFYRAPEKLLYRFICNRLVFAYDDQQTLSLNSCNILIPEISGLDMKFILAVLNSRVAQFLHKKQFHSIKVLRSHLEQIPIPEIPIEEQKRIIWYVDCLREPMPQEESEKIYNELDKLVGELYGLNEREYQIIRDSD
ncbi:MAG: N-6 DNA methylase [Schaedlerella sp.]|nr:N-6 DNA methylase [Schaedlerella sp.]